MRDALAVLDEVIAQLRVSVGITRFDLSLSATRRCRRRRRRRCRRRPTLSWSSSSSPRRRSPTPPAERIGLLQTVMRLIDRAVGAAAG